jgi:hypothetical protein
MADKPNFSRSFDVQQLVERLTKLTIGETATYAELAEIVGGEQDADVFRSQLQSARRIIQRENQIVTAVIRGEGITRLDNLGIVKTGASSIGKIRRESMRGIKRLACADYEQLTQAERAKHDAAASHLAVLGEFSRAKTVEKIEKAAEQKIGKLNVNETLDAFRKK